jgi:hypothetical protein
MATRSSKLAPGSMLLLATAIVGCAPPDGRDDQTTEQKESALTTSLFQPYVTYPTGSHPEAVAIGDLDSDGRNDVALLTSSYFDPANDFMVHVFLQAADGTLKPRVRYPIGGQGHSIDIGDLNGDGRPDVVVGISGGVGTPGLNVLLQNAAGTLDPMVAYATQNANQIKIGDFNGDGRVDVAGLSWGSNGTGLDVFLQTETGTLAPPVTYQVSHGGYDELDAGDIDGDGRTDLVVMSGQQYAIPDLSVLLQTADGALGSPTSYALSGNVLTNGVALGDTNGDGRTDIVVSSGGNSPNAFIARFLQNIQGTMDPAVSYPSYDIPAAIVLADVDGDGRKDALVGHDAYNRLGVYRQYPSGDFLTEEIYSAPYTNLEPQGLAVGDISGDGRPDVVMADVTNGLIVLRHVAEPSLALAVTAPAGGPYYPGFPITSRWTIGDTLAVAGFDVSVSFNGGTTYTSITGCTGLPAGARECVWTPSGAASLARLRVTARDANGQTASSESIFNVVTPLISISGPTATQFIGSATSITWSHNLPLGNTVHIELSRDGGTTFETIATSVPLVSGVNSFGWTVAGPATTRARVRVTTDGAPSATGISGSNFAIATPTLMVTTPAASATVYTTSLSVAWTSNVTSAYFVRIELSRDGGATFETVAAAASNTGSFTGAISGPGATGALIRVTTNGSVVATGTSAPFTLVAPTLAITGPLAGTTFCTGATQTITWSTNLPAGNLVRIDLSRDGGGTFETLATNAPNNGSFNWNVTGPTTASAAIRITITGLGSATATSGPFAIAAPTLSVTGPAGGPVYAGAATMIGWTSNLPASATVRVELSRDGGGTYELLADGAPNTGSFVWMATGPDTAAALVRVTIGGGTTVVGTSALFPIVSPALAVTSPDAGSSHFVGLPFVIGWSGNLPDGGTVKVELSRDGGATFETLADAAPNSGGFVWTATGPDTAAARVRVTVAGPVPMTAISDDFTIATLSLTVTSPSEPSVVYPGTTMAINWTGNVPASSAMRIELSRDSGSTFTTLASAVPNTGSFAFTVTGPDTAPYYAVVRVSATDPLGIAAMSPGFAIVTPQITVTAPGAGASWAIGTSQTISWTSKLSRDGGASYTTLVASAPATGSLPWSVVGPATTTAIVRVSSNGAAPVSGVSGTFAITSGPVSVTSPAAGTSWTIGLPHTITWTSNLSPTATVKIQLSRNGGSTFTNLTTSAPNTGSFAWTPTGAATTTALIKVTVNGTPTAASTSSPFTLASAAVTVTSPNTAVVWTTGSAQTISWTHNLGAGADFKIELTRDAGSTWTVIVASAPSGGDGASGSYAWTVTGPTTKQARIRVTSNGSPTVTDKSDVAFKIQ